MAKKTSATPSNEKELQLVRTTDGVEESTTMTETVWNNLGGNKQGWSVKKPAELSDPAAKAVATSMQKVNEAGEQVQEWSNIQAEENKKLEEARLAASQTAATTAKK